jgi:hypothetical protein
VQVSNEKPLRLQDFGLERLDEDKAIVGFARKAEARLVRWLDFAGRGFLAGVAQRRGERPAGRVRKAWKGRN